MDSLFKADIFSISRPTFSPVSAETASIAQQVAAGFYPELLSGVELIEQFGGNEINSNNFKVASAARRFLLKRLPPTADLKLLDRQISILAWLQEEHSIKVPRVIPNREGRSLTLDNGVSWCLFEFVDGDFFSGGEEQLDATGFEIGRLQYALGKLPSALAVPRKWDYGTTADFEVFQEAEAARSQWGAVFGAQLAAALSQSWPTVARIALELTHKEAQVRAAPVSICHCDLHPHNVLIQNDSLNAFIDFESFTAMPVAASLGFAAYKLVRQHAVSRGISEREPERVANAARRFVDAIDRGGGTVADLEEYRLMAAAEIFRRALVVFRLNLRQGNAAWNHVLPMHLAGLEEIDFLFRPIDNGTSTAWTGI